MSGFENLLKKFGSTGETVEPELPPPSKPGGLEAFIQRHTGMSESFFLYDGKIELRLSEDHVYFLVTELGNLVEQNGVTNTVGIIDKSLMLTPWAAKMAIQKLLRLMPTEMVNGVIRIKPLTFEEFTVIALEAKSAHKDKLDEASDIGHMAHKCLEDSINFAMLNDPEKIIRNLINPPSDAQAMNAATSAKVWMDAHNVRWQETESKIYSKEHEYAGTMDGLALVDSCTDPACCPTSFSDRLSLIDWKSSNHLKIEYLFQTASYKHAKMEEFPDMKILDTWILRLGKSEEEAGKFEPWHMSPEEHDEDFAGFLACLALTRLVDKVSERMKTQKSGIRAVKKEQRATAKAIMKEQDKLKKAMDKAEAKRLKEEEKVRVKTEAKATRDKLKALKKLGIEPEELPEGIAPRSDDVVFLGGITCGSTNPATLLVVEKVVSKLDSTLPTVIGSASKLSSTAPQQVNESTTSTVETKTTSAVCVSRSFEEEVASIKFNIPMEG